MGRSWLWIAAVGVALGGALAVACSGGSDAPTTEPPPTSAAPVAAEARAVWDEPSFELRGDAPGPYTAGTEGHFAIRLTPRGHYHVNQEYPLSITLTGPSGVTFPSSTG